MSGLKTKLNYTLAIVVFIVLLAAMLIVLQEKWRKREEMMDWRLYKSLFVRSDGRVVDTGNQDVSHSEGQGWGMLLAVEHDDRETFARLWHWTRQHLQIRNDKLLSWRWLPDIPANPVPDRNNASDGDIYIAWALLRAGRRWGDEDYLRDARAIATDIERVLVRQYGSYTVLLPGATGFEHDQYLLLNLSYCILPAFAEFEQTYHSPIWQKLYKDSLQLIAKAHFGRWRLPADWISLSTQGMVSIASEHPPRFSYDAIRVPLALLWGKIADEQLLEPYHAFAEFYRGCDTRPAWVNLQDDSVAGYSASPGFEGIIAMAAARQQQRQLPAPPRLTAELDYYAASLVMLARQALLELGQR